MTEPVRASRLRRPALPGKLPAKLPTSLPKPPPLLDRFGIVLALVLATIVVQALIDVRSSFFAGLLTHAISGLALVAAARASGAGRRWRRAVDTLVIGVGALSIVLVAFVRSNDASGGVPPAMLWFFAAALTPVLVARRLVQHAEVTVQTVMGAVAAYLQIAVAFTYAYQTIDAFTPGASFFGEDVSTTTYTYFSLITITTVGFGDYTPVTALGRLVASSEAVMGQVFLVTFVALIVARFAARQPRVGTRSEAELEAAEAARTADSEAQPEPGAPASDA
jgi:voltage-gated potassium channel Kch